MRRSGWIAVIRTIARGKSDSALVRTDPSDSCPISLRPEIASMAFSAVRTSSCAASTIC